MEPNTQGIEAEDETPVRFVDEVFQVVECPHCGHECIWINTEDGWTLCNAEAGSEEPEQHFCPSRPAYIEVPEEGDEATEQKTLVV